MWREEVVAFLMWRGKRNETGDVKSLTTYQDDVEDDAMTLHWHRPVPIPVLLTSSTNSEELGKIQLPTG
jgi:hypothetical protein